ncbi:MAG: carbonic anhydrase family protein [Rhizomicrobium sp.]
MHRRIVAGGFAAVLAVAFSGLVALGQAPAGQPLGDQQSPIVITGAIPAHIQPLQIRYPRGLAEFDVYNDGHTIKVAPLRVTYETMYDGKTYKLSEFHFHHPAEHQVANAPPPAPQMEVHFVNKNADGTAVVFGVFVDAGGQNPAFATVMRAAPLQPGVHVVVHIDPSELLPADHHYWMYMGSLTTPDYDQVVRWIVLKHHVRVDQPSIDKFASIFPNDAREVQDLNRRFILEGPAH